MASLHKWRMLAPLIGWALAVLLLDQFSKWWLLEVFDIPHRSPYWVTEFFSLVMVWNYGVSFGMFAGQEMYVMYGLVALAMVICGILTRMALKTADGFERIAYAVIIGGAIGNVIDRLRFGAVADFFYFHIGQWGWPAFNVADMGICVGVLYLFWRYLWKKPQAEIKPENLGE